jgi:spermidine synthase
MAAWEELGATVLSTGETLSLSRKGDDYSLGVNDLVLMTSKSYESERQLAILGCGHLANQVRSRVIVGGLGMGFTLRAALDVLPADAQVDVAELIPKMVDWNRTTMGHLAQYPLEDPRTQLIQGDVLEILRASENVYDAVMLDIDNGPEAFTTTANSGLYTDEGVQVIQRALRPRGVLSLWSVWDDGHFTGRLRDHGFHVWKKRVPARVGGNNVHLLWLATRVR